MKGLIRDRYGPPDVHSRATGRLLREMCPSREGRNTLGVDEKQHVPSSRRNVWILRNFRSHDSAGAAGHFQIDQTLAAIERMRGDAGANQAGPADVGGLRRLDLDCLPIGALLGCRSNRGTQAFEEVWWAEDFQTHFFFGIVVPFYVCAAIGIASGGYDRTVGQQESSGMVQAWNGGGRHGCRGIGGGIVDFGLQAR